VWGVVVKWEKSWLLDVRSLGRLGCRPPGRHTIRMDVYLYIYGLGPSADAPDALPLGPALTGEVAVISIFMSPLDLGTASPPDPGLRRGDGGRRRPNLPSRTGNTSRRIEAERGRSGLGSGGEH
jgi:hypothetical protein